MVLSHLARPLEAFYFNQLGQEHNFLDPSARDSVVR